MYNIRLVFNLKFIIMVYVNIILNNVAAADIDTRFIIIPAGRNITDDELEALYQEDKKYPFRGPLYKLPRQIQ